MPPAPPPAPPMNLLAFGKASPFSSGGANLPPPPFAPPAPQTPSMGLSEPTGSSFAFPGRQTYTYPVPNINPPEASRVIIRSADIQKPPVMFGKDAVKEHLENSNDSSEFRVMVGKIETSVSDLELNMILSVIGDFIMFEKPKVKDASKFILLFMVIFIRHASDVLFDRI